MIERREASPFIQLLLIVGLMIGGVLLSIFGSFLFLIIAYGAESAVSVWVNVAQHIEALKAMQTIQGICMFIVPAYFFSKILYGKGISFLKMNKPIGLQLSIVVILLMITAIPFINFLGFINEKMVLPDALAELERWMRAAEMRAAEMTKLLVATDSVRGLFFNVFMIAIVPAVGEEMLFRGVLQPVVYKSVKNIHVAVVVTALIFSAFHLQFYGFLPRFFIGIILGYLYVYSGSLWLPILAHFVNNALVTVAYFLMNKGVIGNEIDTIGTAENWYFGVISAFILVIIYFFIEHNKTQLKFDEFK